jgi:hypothetical protein
VPFCRHCVHSWANRPRGLCWSCYYLPGVRDLYPSTSKHGRRGVGNGFRNAPAPSCPTSAAPGSEEKIEILAERARTRQALWHPDDVTMGGGLEGLLADCFV